MALGHDSGWGEGANREEGVGVKRDVVGGEGGAALSRIRVGFECGRFGHWHERERERR